VDSPQAKDPPQAENPALPMLFDNVKTQREKQKLNRLSGGTELNLKTN